MEIEWTEELAKKYRDELGAVHLGVIRGIQSTGAGNIRVAKLGDQLAGMFLTRKVLKADERIIPIIAAAVPEDLRLMHIASELLDTAGREAAREGRSIMQAICRCDLASNAFWLLAGFTPCFVRDTNSVRQKRGIVWRKALTTAATALTTRIAPERERGGGGRFLGPPKDTETMLMWPEDPGPKYRPERYISDIDAIGDALCRGITDVAAVMTAIERRKTADRP